MIVPVAGITRWAVLLVALTASGHLRADTLKGRVVRILDGDTLAVLDSAKREHLVRIAGIDAPEPGQANYETSRQHLGSLVIGKMVTVEWRKRDRYGRLVGKVSADLDDVGLQQVRAGQAWWYRDSAHEQTAFDRSRYESAEQDARLARRGLWNGSRPIPPWQW